MIFGGIYDRKKLVNIHSPVNVQIGDIRFPIVGSYEIQQTENLVDTSGGQQLFHTWLLERKGG